MTGSNVIGVTSQSEPPAVAGGNVILRVVSGSIDVLVFLNSAFGTRIIPKAKRPLLSGTDLLKDDRFYAKVLSEYVATGYGRRFRLTRTNSASGTRIIPKAKRPLLSGTDLLNDDRFYAKVLFEYVATGYGRRFRLTRTHVTRSARGK